MRKTRSLLLLAIAAAPLAYAQTPFATFEVKAEVALQPSPILRTTLSVEVKFAPDPLGLISPATEIVALDFVPPTPIVPPNPSNVQLTNWELQFPAGCFRLSRSGQFRVENFATCGARLRLFFDDGTSADRTDLIFSIESDIKPPTGRNTDWRFRLGLELGAEPPDPVLPPDPIRGSTMLKIGDDVGEAAHTLVSWEGHPPPDDG